MGRKNIGPQVNVRLSEQYLGIIDNMVELKEVSSRSDFIREAVESLLMSRGKIAGKRDENEMERVLAQILGERVLTEIKSLVNHPHLSSIWGEESIYTFFQAAVSSRKIAQQEELPVIEQRMKILKRYGREVFIAFLYYDGIPPRRNEYLVDMDEKYYLPDITEEEVKNVLSRFRGLPYSYRNRPSIDDIKIILNHH